MDIWKRIKFGESFTLLRFICWLHIFFAQYYSLRSSIIINTFIAIYCIIVATCVVICHIFYKRFIAIITMPLIFFVLHAIHHLFNGNKYFLKFFTSMKLVDTDMGLNCIPVLSINIKIAALTSLFLRTSLFIISRFILRFQGSIGVDLIAIIYPFNSNDLTVLTRSIVFDVLYTRMKLLRTSFDEELKCLNGIEPVPLKITRIRNHLRIYYKMLDNLNEADIQLQITILISLMHLFLSLLSFVYNLVKAYMDEGQNNIIAIFIAVQVLHAILLVMTPAIFVELAANEGQKIKILLTMAIARCTDKEILEELEHARSAVQWRPLQFRICRYVSINTTLLLSYLGLFLSYFIVLLQFGHFDFSKQ